MIDSKFEKYHEYMRNHKIPELFEDLCTSIAYKQPADVRLFLISQLELRQSKNAVTLPIFTDQEVENIFYLYNLKKEDSIPKFKAKEALKCMAHSKFDFEAIEREQTIPENVNIDTFKALAHKVLGVTL